MVMEKSMEPAQILEESFISIFAGGYLERTHKLWRHTPRFTIYFSLFLPVSPLWLVISTYLLADLPPLFDGVIPSFLIQIPLVVAQLTVFTESLLLKSPYMSCSPNNPNSEPEIINFPLLQLSLCRVKSQVSQLSRLRRGPTFGQIPGTAGPRSTVGLNDVLVPSDGRVCDL